MKFDLISDFHVEMNNPNQREPGDTRPREEIPFYYPWDRQKQSDVLVIAGDTSNTPDNTIRVLDEARRYYETVIFVDGNHDHYVGYREPDRTVGVNTTFFQNYVYGHAGIEYLDGLHTVLFGDCLFIGANGWYDWKTHPYSSREQQHQDWKRDMNDSRCIRFDPEGYPDKLALLQAERLAKHVEEAQEDDAIRQIVVVTHTIPHRYGLISDSHPWAYLNGSYLNTEMRRVWEADRAGKIRNWVFGHTHFFYDFMAEGGIRFTTNPRGYRGEERSQSFPGIRQIDTEEVWALLAPTDSEG